MTALANIGESMDDVMRWSYRDRVSNLMRGGGGESAEQQDSTDAGRYLEHTQGMAARLVEKLRIPFGASRLGACRNEMAFLTTRHCPK